MSETPHHVDISVGQAVRAERKARGFTQERLARAIGVSFQQLQKYERGANRISASKLHDISRVLGVRVTVFFGGEQEGAGDGEPTDFRLHEQLARLSPNGRHAVLTVVAALGDGQA